MERMFGLLVLLAALAMSHRVHAQAAPAAPLVLGVQTHLAQTPPKTSVGVLRQWIAQSRFTSTRDEMLWDDVDVDGKLALRRGALQTQAAWAAMPPPFAGLFTADFGNSAWDHGGQPKSPAARDAYARYVRFVTAQVQPRWVEIWNEWNLKSGARAEGGSDGSAGDYVQLARVTYRALKAERPTANAIVLTGASGDDFPDFPWLQSAIAQGLLDATDAVAVHLYNHCMGAARVGADEMAQRLDQLHGAISAAGHPDMPIYVTEVGWPTHDGDCAVTEAAQALHSVRFLLEAAMRPWVAGVWFYELEDGPDPHNREHRFGLLRENGADKPAGCALRELGATIAARPVLVQAGSGMAAAAFRNGATDRWLIWTRGTQQRAMLARVDAPLGGLDSAQSPRICSLPATLMQVDADGRAATLRLEARAVHVLDVPTGTALHIQELR